MESDELRERLFVSFRSAGVLGAVKSQLRAAMLEQLHKQDESLFKASGGKGRPSLQERLVKSMFIEYLEKCGYSFTQSVFVPESQMEDWPRFTQEEMRQILRLELPAAHQEGPRSSCLAEHLLALVQLPATPKSRRDASAQTEETGPKNLELWLKEIDDNCLRRLDAQKCRYSYSSPSLEEHMSIFYQDFENRVRAEVDAQVARIREFELEKVRTEEAAQYRRQVAAVRKDLEDMHKSRFELLSQRQEEFLERMLQKQKEVESLGYHQRQKLLEDMENLHLREEKLKTETEAQERTFEQREEKLCLRETRVKMQEEDVNHLRDFLHTQTEEVLSMKKDQLEKEYQSLQKQLTLERAVLEDERTKLREEKHAFAAEVSSSRSDKELVQALYRRLSAEETQKKALLTKINELENATRS